jgi:hypothetical protein
MKRAKASAAAAAAALLFFLLCSWQDVATSSSGTECFRFAVNCVAEKNNRVRLCAFRNIVMAFLRH